MAEVDDSAPGKLATSQGVAFGSARRVIRFSGEAVTRRSVHLIRGNSSVEIDQYCAYFASSTNSGKPGEHLDLG